jgi:perosamine synthetase
MIHNFIPLSVPNLKGKELEYVSEAVRAEWVSTAGAYVNEFERVIAEYVGVEKAVACQNGTAGLHTAYMLAGIKPGDLVIVPTLTFIAAVNPIKYIGADPIFFDCDSSLCIDPAKLDEFCQFECEFRDGVLYHKATTRRISAVVVVHVFGNMADMERIIPIARKYHLKVVEDATEALGTKYLEGTFAGRYAGTIGDIGVYSFNGNKIITTGGGGMIVSNNVSLMNRAKHLTTQAKVDTVRFIHDEIGFNYRLTNMQAALGLAQMEQLERFISIKERNYKAYLAYFDKIKGVTLMEFRKGTRSNHWFYSLYRQSDFLLSRDQIMNMLGEKQVQTRPIWGLIHQQKPYVNSLCYRIDQAFDYHKNIVNLPCSTNLTVDDVEYVCKCFEGVDNATI